MKGAIFHSPLGELTLTSNGQALVGLEFEQQKYPRPPAPRGADHVLDAARRELERYFAGELRVFETPIAPEGTSFQRRVWAGLLRIPYGETWTYARLAAAIGAPRAARAVGAANGRNPISIIGPCHRVIGADGALTGYGGGLGRKQKLLALEQGRPC